MTEINEGWDYPRQGFATRLRKRWLGHLWPRATKNPQVGIALVNAVAFVALATLARFGIGLIAHNTAIFITYHPAILLATLIAGAWSGLFAMLLGGLAGWWFFIPPQFSFAPLNGDQGITMALYVAVAILLIVIAESHRQLSHRAALDAHQRSLLANVPDAMVIVDPTGIIRSFSSAAERLFGYSEREAIGCNIDILLPSAREANGTHITRYFQTEHEQTVGSGPGAVGERKNGSTFPIELVVGEIDSDGQRFFTVFIRNVTERHKYEARLQELQSELIHLSRLTAMGEMASALAHELNQPLSAITNYVSGSRRLLADNSDEQSHHIREALDQAAEQSLRAGRIINRLRDFVAHRESEKRSESLQKVTEEAVILALVGTRELGVRVRYAFDRSRDPVLVDKVQIQQVVLNLVRNAVEAMHSSDRRELVVSTTSGQGNMAIVSIADTGSGISAEISDQLFRPFITTKSHGMGIGLSISRTIIEAHGGKIWVEPNPGGGTVFCFTLPRLAEGSGDSGATIS